MKHALANLFWAVLAITCGPESAGAGALAVTVPVPPPPQTTGFNMGQSRRPDGATLTLDTYSLRLNGKPWTPIMGEFHYARCPANEWREELLKIKAGGVDIVATYVFWIHHEEIEGQFDWSERRNLRHFLELCGEVGLKAVVRCGPWCHGEVRNGGQPDWLLKKGWKLRSDDPDYLAKVKVLYAEIAKQLSGLLWKDSGPVIGIQFENEYWGPAQHLLTLKRIAREVGLDVPLYTRTGWPGLSTPMPFGEIVPLYGVYAEGFWDREITPMPGQYWAGFHFSPLRTDANIANELLGRRDARDDADVAQYPYLTCEIGGGMMNSYHRRILVNPADIDSTTLVKLGSGSSLPGYYMYHGGVNPEGKLSTLMESQATEYWNDLPVKNYDFQTALGQYGQVRPQYHSLCRLHLFLHEWGPALAGMPASMPDQRPKGKDDVDTLRWCVRSDGNAGFVFVNNYERLKPLPPKKDVQFGIKLPSGSITFPSTPVTVPAESRFFWPFNLDLGNGVRLAWATAQPICAVEDGRTRTVFFAQTTGVPAEFAFPDDTGLVARSGKAVRHDGHALVRGIKPTTSVALQVTGSRGREVRIVLLDETDSLALWKFTWQGRDRVFLSRAGLVVDGALLRLTSGDREQLGVGVFPAPKGVTSDGRKLPGKADGVFTRFAPPLPKALSPKVSFEQIQAAGPPRDIPLGKIKQAVPAAPEDADFAKAAVWRLKLPTDLALACDPLLRLDYTGDVARVTLNGKLLTDDFYNGKPFEVGLRRRAPEILNGDLQVAILPLRKDAPIYLASEAWPNFGGARSVAELKAVRIVPRYQAQLTAQ
jgi:beta-galactosidase